MGLVTTQRQQHSHQAPRPARRRTDDNARKALPPYDGPKLTGWRVVHRFGRHMRARGSGRILFTGSIAGFMPGTFNAVYNGSKAFIDSFSFALRNELKDSGVTVTCLMPGVTDTNFFERAGMLDTKFATGDKSDPSEVAKTGFDAMMKGEGGVIAGLKNKLQVAAATHMGKEAAAEMHRRQAAPGTGKSGGARSGDQTSAPHAAQGPGRAAGRGRGGQERPGDTG